MCGAEGGGSGHVEVGGKPRAQVKRWRQQPDRMTPTDSRSRVAGASATRGVQQGRLGWLEFDVCVWWQFGPLLERPHSGRLFASDEVWVQPEPIMPTG